MDEAPTEEMKAEETKPEDKAPEAAPAPAETPPAPPAVESPAAPPRPPRKENWLLIALIAVSIIAVLLLVSTSVSPFSTKEGADAARGSR